MSFRGGLREFLVDNVPAVANRIYPSMLPNTFQTPALVYRVITDVADIAHDGPAGLHNPRVQFDVWSKTPTQAEEVAEQIEAAMLAYVGPMGDIPYTGGWRIDSTTDFFEEDTRLYRISTDYRGWYQPVA